MEEERSRFNISPESDFYGDTEMVMELEERVRCADLRECIAAVAASAAPGVTASPRPSVVVGWNPYAGMRGAWQLDETIAQFLARMPPATTTGVEWIWVCNPFVGREAGDAAVKTEAAARQMEGPLPRDSMIRELEQGGMERLHLLSNLIEHATRLIPVQTTRAREVAKETCQAAKDILELARATRVTCGKWMLFVSPHNVNEVWAKVAEATSKGELGTGAKVAPKEEDRLMRDPSRARLICVYTRDFAQLDDVGRVLRRLRDLRLFAPGFGQIYYKPDAFTYIGLDGSNKWNIRPSIYGSKRILQYMDARDGGMPSADDTPGGWLSCAEWTRSG